MCPLQCIALLSCTSHCKLPLVIWPMQVLHSFYPQHPTQDARSDMIYTMFYIVLLQHPTQYATSDMIYRMFYIVFVATPLPICYDLHNILHCFLVYLEIIYLEMFLHRGETQIQDQNK